MKIRWFNVSLKAGFFWGFFLALTVASTALYADSAQPALNNILQRYRRDYQISGSLYIIRHGQSYGGSVGLANDGAGKPNAADTLFSIASNSKQFVASALLKLEEMGRLKMSDPISKYFPEYPKENLHVNGREVTIADMMQNVSGLGAPYYKPELKAKSFREPILFREILDAMKTDALLFEPGTQFLYTDIGFILGGEIVRRVSGRTYTAFTRKFLFGLLNPNNIQVDKLQNKKRIARSYFLQNGVRKDFFIANNIREGYTTDDFTDGNIFVTAPELAKWTRNLVSGKVLCEKSLTKMFSPSPVSVADGAPYGYAWNILQDANHRKYYTHDGHFLGYNSRMIVYPQEETSIIWLSNQEMGEENESFFADILHAVLP